MFGSFIHIVRASQMSFWKQERWNLPDFASDYYRICILISSKTGLDLPLKEESFVLKEALEFAL